MTSYDDIAIFIGARIKRAREEKGLSQTELGNSIGKTKVTISDMEHAKVGVGAVDLSIIAKKLGQPLNYFYPRLARISIKEGELNTNETKLVEAYRELDSFALEKLFLTFIEGFAKENRKGKTRRSVEDVREGIDILRAKDA